MRKQFNRFNNWEHSNRRSAYRPYDALTMSRDEWLRKLVLPRAKDILLTGGYYAVSVLLRKYGISKSELRTIQRIFKEMY